MTELLTDRIKRHEGFRSRIYRDSLGNDTIGYGHLVKSHEYKRFAVPLTKAAAYDLLIIDIGQAEHYASVALGFFKTLDRARQEVIVEMVFQLGFCKVLSFRRLCAALDAHDYARAAAEILDSRWHEQTPLRCQELAKVMASPQPAGASA